MNQYQSTCKAESVFYKKLYTNSPNICMCFFHWIQCDLWQTSDQVAVLQSQKYCKFQFLEFEHQVKTDKFKSGYESLTVSFESETSHNALITKCKAKET